ncbi:hypothetical protein D5R81_08440 [Parashewanella spongiae]|uniref:Uncharacterized protein n=1 Tax=Parashewanella spongiae TaxID=342950 RepID=A0A3A6U6F1_9GAMM|nr:FlhC family transcriptional regulator [Parashewanella spongiae]MCL1078026.1 FlhC family transcriptional regulator [Parashewanella spongiae]RJY17454.1 hypothetical protein D5R81_08440 [Parashewanella spongiae]
MNHLQQSQQTLKAAKYIEYGLKTSIIEHYTQLPVKYLRTLCKDVTGKSPTSGQLITVPRLFKNKRAAIACILFVSIYLKANHSSSRRVDLELLLSAFDCFTNQLVQLDEMNEDKLSFNINDAWVLMNAYMNHIIEFVPCCCGSVSVSSQVFDVETKCPFCAFGGHFRYGLEDLDVLLG